MQQSTSKRTLGLAPLFALLLAVLSLGACDADSHRTTEAPDADAPSAAESMVVEATPLPEGAEAAADTIGEEGLRVRIAEFSDDALEGRAPGTPGDEMAQEWLVAQMTAAGLEPAGVDGTWRQPFDVVSVEAAVPDTWSFRSETETLDLALRSDFIASSGVQSPTASIDGAEVVFVGYGIEAPEYDWDDFAGTDVAGKVLLMLNNDPDWDPELFEGNRRLYYGRWTYKYEQAAKHGAAGAIIIHTRPSAGYPWSVVESSWSGPQVELPATDAPRTQITGWVTEGAAEQLVTLAGHEMASLVESARSKDFTPVPLGITTSLALANTIESTQTANVLGRLPGGAAADEVVLYGAHFDHLGVGEPDADGDTIHNGALDNAAGIAQMLSIAEAMSGLPEPPRRTVVFAAWGAEESGLLGSKFFSDNPTVPAGKIAANFNIDGGNIWGASTDVVFIGYGKSDLDSVVERHAAAQDRRVLGDQFPDRGFYYRSDQLSLARIGVPAVYLDTGTKFRDRDDAWGKEQIEAWEGMHYHQPSDEMTDDWNFDGMVEDTRLLFAVGLETAMRESMPAWRPGDEFEAARKAALGG